MTTNELGRDCTLKVKDFLCLKDVECEFKGINVLIGPQAEGKSLIAKLVYFFQEFLFKSIHDGLESDSTLDSIVSSGLLSFYKYFPGEIWLHSNFIIEYQHGPYTLTVRNKGDISLILSDNLQDDITEIANIIDWERDDHLNQYDDVDDEYEALSSFDASSFIPDHFFKQILFVPAQRNLLSMLQGNIFTTIKEQGYIDPLLISYGSKFESINNFIHFTKKYGKKDGLDPLERTRTRFIDSINDNLGEFFKGEYSTVDKETIIKTHHGDVKLQYSSSGQQEVVPLAPIATFRHNSIFVEEPEAHLYPSSQKGVIQFFTKQYNETSNQSFTITTHSPYTLSTLNNLIAAHSIFEDDSSKESEISEIIPRDCWLPYGDVTAWYIQAGTARSIMNPETQLIDANAIDDVSEVLAEEFDALLDIGYRDEDES